ncbi:adiponectin isoform X2 [Oncorhynchus kisutch]|uniref:adiponectin isoform X2 n=1 Tax=Oncorhynchus kisutch TaxID=8019 RepID=UPI0012DF6C0F|nr:adiponectin-like isoform X2 [Oncorhynchus kisutch]
MVTMSWMLLLCVLAEGYGSEVGVQEGCGHWMGGVPGTPGLDGQDGRDGREGRQGETGDTGLPGVRGERGEVGEVGEDGFQGRRGFPGAPGLQGQRGESSFLYRSAFSVGLTTPTTTTDTPLHFTKIFYNEQHHYDDISGKFRCFIPGVYYFTFHLTVQFLTSDLDQSSGGAVLNLSSGDQVWLQVYGAEQEEVGIYADINNDSTFTGFLIQPRLPSSPLDNRRR